MIRMCISLVLAAAAVGAISLSAMSEDKVSPPATAPANVPAALNFAVKDIDGKDVKLSDYSGKVILILNVASYCGNTPQYTALEKLYTDNKDKGFVILGFPANNFGGQEPGSDAQIKQFCTAEDSKYHVTFPLMSKVSVKGDDIAPLFKYLTTQESKPLSKGDIKWNFEKFLISRDGKLVGRFDNKMKPDNPAIVSAVSDAIAAK